MIVKTVSQQFAVINFWNLENTDPIKRFYYGALCHQVGTLLQHKKQ